MGVIGPVELAVWAEREILKANPPRWLAELALASARASADIQRTLREAARDSVVLTDGQTALAFLGRALRENGISNRLAILGALSLLSSEGRVQWRLPPELRDELERMQEFEGLAEAVAPPPST